MSVFDAAELLEEVDVEIRAAELAVGDRLQAGVLLHLHDLGDRAILDRPQVRRRDLAARLPVARLQQVLRAQEAADVIGAERRCRALAHGVRPREIARAAIRLARRFNQIAAGLSRRAAATAVTLAAAVGPGQLLDHRDHRLLQRRRRALRRGHDGQRAPELRLDDGPGVQALRRRCALHRARRQHREAVPLGHQLQDRRHGVDLQRDVRPQAQARQGGPRPASGSHGDGWG